MSASSKRIVIIDGDRDAMTVLEALLRKHGFFPHAAATGTEGRKQVEETNPALVLLECKLPDVQGLDLLSEFKEDAPDRPVIVLTSDNSLENAIESIKRGAFHFVGKPYDPDTLICLVNKALPPSGRNGSGSSGRN